MATRSGPNRLRNPSLKDGIVVDTVRGKVRVRIRPRKRGKPKSPMTQFQNAWFKDVMNKLKYVDGRAADWAYRQTKQTGLYPRDILTRAMTKGMFEIPDGEGNILRPKQQGVWTVSFQGARLEKTATQAVAGSTTTSVTWGVALIDTAGFFNGAAPSRVTIPAGVNIVNIRGSVRFTASTVRRTYYQILKNGSAVVATSDSNANPWGAQEIATGPLQVSEADYFELQVFLSGAKTIDNVTSTNLTVEILDASFSVP